MSMSTDSFHTENHASMLNSPVRVSEAGADCANLGPDGMTDHFAQPIGADNFEIIIQQSKKIAAGL